ncbi:branched-chain amino acid ABC transporter permease [Actinomadura sp. WMMB 499]|uniref:branched-chain amino acid ABC transporter permease n=1 Tax=Actinomadura sp. WMMB 499 TaxID=1219491 RepID=UPI001247F926|nr:branched-chain amino acid ABC transporter permease [Actinomadura sp. WMMB 499]QFG26146.1 branched-chain amino acid ABC transporter permease [Actinomadura sp. WMMB 499]
MTTVWTGLAIGAVYTLVAVGYNITMAQSGIFNFTQGQITVFSCFFAWFTMVDLGLPWWLAAGAGAVVCGLIGLLVELLAIRPVVARHGAHGHAVLVTTVGAFVVILGALAATWGQSPKTLPFFGGTETITLLGGKLSPVDLWLVAAAVAAAVGMHVVSGRTAWGLSGRAATDNPDAAKAKGVNVTALRTTAFMLAGGLAGLLGPVVGPKIGVDVSVAVSLTIYGFVAVALGGFGSYLGCLIGGVAVGLLEAGAGRYFGAEYPPLILFGLLVAILLARPTGLLGNRGLRVV